MASGVPAAARAGRQRAAALGAISERLLFPPSEGGPLYPPSHLLPDPRRVGTPPLSACRRRAALPRHAAPPQQVGGSVRARHRCDPCGRDLGQGPGLAAASALCLPALQPAPQAREPSCLHRIAPPLMPFWGYPPTPPHPPQPTHTHTHTLHPVPAVPPPHPTPRTPAPPHPLTAPTHPPCSVHGGPHHRPAVQPCGRVRLGARVGGGRGGAPRGGGRGRRCLGRQPQGARGHP